MNQISGPLTPYLTVRSIPSIGRRMRFYNSHIQYFSLLLKRHIGFIILSGCSKTGLGVVEETTFWSGPTLKDFDKDRPDIVNLKNSRMLPSRHRSLANNVNLLVIADRPGIPAPRHWGTAMFEKPLAFNYVSNANSYQFNR